VFNYFWLLWIFARPEAFYECIDAFSETNFTEDIKNFDVPMLVRDADE